MVKKTPKFTQTRRPAKQKRNKKQTTQKPKPTPPNAPLSEVHRHHVEMMVVAKRVLQKAGYEVTKGCMATWLKRWRGVEKPGGSGSKPNGYLFGDDPPKVVYFKGLKGMFTGVAGFWPTTKWLQVPTWFCELLVSF